ncbi:MAG TPA: amidohydrolase family protein [Gemmatimonadales bacterium]|nr:amidohydrolase family protein [Gemmatimonadales bacterium]
MRRLLITTFLVVPALLLAQDPPPAPRDTTKKADTTAVKDTLLPLKMARTVSFETSEATWMSLDVSPDGTTIVFELLGDLYTLPVGGGTATRITSGPGFDSQPRWSPDGKRIVFLSDRGGAENVWLCDPDGSHPKALTKGATNLYASPDWTLDGNYIVVSRTSGFLGSTYELWLIHKDGGSGAAMLRVQTGPNMPPPMNTLGAAFGKDPRYIWVSRHRGGFGYNLDYPLWQLAIYDRQTGRLFTQTDMYGSAMRPVLSSDGKWLVYATRYDAETGLRLRNLASGDEKWLVYPVTRDDQESRFTRDLYPGYSFTPDNQAIIVSYGGKIHRVAVPSGQVTDILFTAKVDQQLGPMVHLPIRVDTGSVLVRQIRDASPSPDGKRLAFSALDRLYVMDLPNGTPRRLTNDSVKEQVPAWSPDGQWLAYVTWTDAGGTLNKIKPDGRSRPVRLTADSAFYDTPVWSPDGARIVVVKGPRAPRTEEHFGPGYEIVWVPAAGGAVTRISPINAWGRPHFSRDPNRIYIYEGPEGLVSMRYDGTDRRAHIRVTGYTSPTPGAEANPAGEVIISPDSDRVLALVGNYVYLVTLPLIGGQTPVVNVSDPSSAAFPVKRLTMIGGDFIGWTNDGRQAFWSIGRSFLKWDPAVADSMDKIKARTDSIRADSLKTDAFKALADSVQKRLRARSDSLAKHPAYDPQRSDVTINVPRDIPRGTVVLRGARIISMKGDEVIDNGDVVVTDNHIVSVGARGNAPAGARVIDVTGKTIMPGFVDVHAHPWPTWGIHETQVWKYLANLAWGVTTTRDPQTATTDVLTYADLVETGEILGPRIFHTGPGVFWSEDFKSLEDTRQALRRYSDFYRIHTIKMYMTGNRKQRQWVIMAAKELGLMPTIEGGLDFKMNLTAVIDGYPGSEHSYPIMPLYRDAVQLVAQSGITYTPTLLVSYGGPWSENFFYERYDIHDNAKVRRFMPHDEIDQRAERRRWFRESEYVFPRIAASANAILQAGGHIGLGGHGQMDGLGDHWELWAMAAGGMSNHDVLRVATLHGANAIGMEQDLGSLEPGKLADLIVLDANPLEDIHNTNTVRYVMKNGRLYEGDTLNEVWPRQRALPRMWWWGTEPTKAAETLR